MQAIAFANVWLAIAFLCQCQEEQYFYLRKGTNHPPVSH